MEHEGSIIGDSIWNFFGDFMGICDWFWPSGAQKTWLAGEFPSLAMEVFMGKSSH